MTSPESVLVFPVWPTSVVITVKLQESVFTVCGRRSFVACLFARHARAYDEKSAGVTSQSGTG